MSLSKKPSVELPPHLSLPHKGKAESNPLNSVFISLYFILLVFFILLCSSSSFDEKKVLAARESLTKVFSSRPVSDSEANFMLFFNLGHPPSPARQFLEDDRFFLSFPHQSDFSQNLERVIAFLHTEKTSAKRIYDLEIISVFNSLPQQEKYIAQTVALAARLKEKDISIPFVSVRISPQEEDRLLFIFTPRSGRSKPE